MKAARAPRWRATVRMATRNVRRDLRTSALVALLIALPVAALTATAVAVDSHEPRPTERALTEVGQADAWLRIVGGAQEERRQFLDQPELTNLDIVTDPDAPPPVYGPVPKDITALLPEDTELLRTWPTQVEAQTEGGIGLLRATVGDIAHPSLDGHLVLREGRRPLGSEEAAVSPGALERLGAQLGDTLTLTDPESSFTITGVMAHAVDPDAAEVLFLPETPALDARSVAPTDVTWFALGWAPGLAELDALNAAGVVAFVPELAANPGDRAYGPMSYSNPFFTALFAAAAVVFASYLIVLLAGAAIAVSARRQQRQLAVAVSVGASRGDVFRTVLLQGSVLGLAGGIAGAGVGIGIGAAVLPFGADGSAARPWGFHVPWLVLLALVLFAALVGTLAALPPAWAASRQQTLTALRGARRPVSVRSRRPVWGSLLILSGLVMTVGAGLAMAMFYRGGLPHQPLVVSALPFVLIGGPVVFQLGVIVSGHWLLTRLARLLAPIGVAARLAGRDIASAPSRAVPAFGAIAACVFLAATAAGTTAALAAADERRWTYSAPVGGVELQIHAWDREIGTRGAQIGDASQAAIARLAETAPSALAEVRTALDPMDIVDRGHDDTVFVRPALQRWDSCVDAHAEERSPRVQSCAWPKWAPWGHANGAQAELAIVAPDDLALVLDTELSDAQIARYASGVAVVTEERWLTDDGRLVLNTFDLGQYRDLDSAELDSAATAPLASAEIPAFVVEQPRPSLNRAVLLPPSLAEEHQVSAELTHVIAAYETPLTTQAMDRLHRDLGEITQRLAPENSLFLNAYREDGPPDPSPLLWAILGGAAVLVIGAAAVALGLSRVERRADDATLAAVGASPRLRRAVSFWQGAVLVGVGSITGTAAGVLLTWGFALAVLVDDMRVADAPWPLLALLAVGLPLGIAFASWLVPPRHPDLSRRRAIG